MFPVEIPEGTTQATFDLTWNRDWSKFPTSDIDMIIFDPNYALASIDGATGNAPEHAVIMNPWRSPGTSWLKGMNSTSRITSIYFSPWNKAKTNLKIDP